MSEPARAWGTCSACGKATRPDNESGLCWLCAPKACWRSTEACACGCGRTLDKRNTSGLARTCLAREAMRLVRNTFDNRIAMRRTPGRKVQGGGK